MSTLVAASYRTLSRRASISHPPWSCRFFKKPIHNDLVELVLKRVKCMLGYPESRPEMINPNSVLYRYTSRSCACVSGL